MPRQVYVMVAMLGGFAVHAGDLVDRADANGDGYVSLYELRAAHYADAEFNQRIEQSFASYDSNGDGMISEAERQAKRAASLATAESARGEDPISEMVAAPVAGASPEKWQATGVAGAAAALTTLSDEPIQDLGADPAAMSEADDAPAQGSTAVALTDEDADPVGEVADTASLSRTESWILQIDADNSGGASVAELIESGDGQQWFTDQAFESADENGDRDLDPAELEVLLQSMERRRRSVR